MNHRLDVLGTPALLPAVLVLVVVSALMLSLAPSSAVAAAGPIGFNAFGGVYSGGVDEFFLGAGVRFSLAGITLAPNAEYIFVDNGSAYTMNADATVTVLPLVVASGYVGGGLGLFVVDPDNGESQTESVINLIVGASLNAIPLKAYGQIKYVIVEEDDPFVFTVGVRF